MPANYKDIKSRDLQYIRDIPKIHQVIRKNFTNNSLLLGGSDTPIEVRIRGFRGEKGLMIDLGSYPAQKDEELILYKILDRYIHIAGHVKDTGILGGQAHLFFVDHLAVAKAHRSSTRIPIDTEEGSVFASNFRTSRFEIDENTLSIPVFIKMGLASFEKQLKIVNYADNIYLHFLTPENIRKDNLLRILRNNNKPILVQDCLDPSSYKPFNSSYLDYSHILGDGLKDKIESCRHKKIVSEIYIPAIYITHDQTSFCIASIQMQRKLRKFTPMDVKDIWLQSKTTLKKIQDSNTVFIKSRQSILDISENGLRIFITDEQLKTSLVRQRGFTFDLLFRMQSPITLYAMIRSIAHVENGIKIGVEIQAHSSRQRDFARFCNNVKELSAESVDTSKDS